MVTLPAWGLMLWTIGTLIVSGLGGAWGAYWVERGKNAATKDDIEELTRLTKQIEAEISTGVWDKQKRWDMKREVLFDAARRLSELDDALLSYSVTMKEDRAQKLAWEIKKPSDDEILGWEQPKNERLARWMKASTEFDQSRLFVSIVCSK